MLIGENNTGKSTVLEAIRLVLTRGFGVRRDGRFTEYDFHLKNANATPQTADPISITLHFAEKQESEWPDTVVQQMSEVIQLDTVGLNHIWLQVKGSYQAESGSFETKLAFLNASGVELPLKNATPLNLISRFVPLFLLSALRDASQEFGQRGQFWSGFLKSIQIPDDQRERIEEMLREVNTSVIGANAGLTEVTNKIADARRLVPLDSADPVILEAIPTRVFDMVGKIQTDDPDWETYREVVGDLTGLRVLTADSITDGIALYKEAVSKVPANEYSELLTVRDGQENVRIWIKDSGNIVHELLLLVGSPDEFVLLSITGKIDLDKISTLSKALDVQGIDQLDKVKSSKN